jgi:hypothetical protein
VSDYDVDAWILMVYGQTPPPLVKEPPRERAYQCLACDVLGWGTACWYCGSERLAWGNSYNDSQGRQRPNEE